MLIKFQSIDNKGRTLFWLWSTPGHHLGLDNGHKSRLKMCVFNLLLAFAWQSTTDNSMVSSRAGILFRAACRVVNQLTLRPQTGQTRLRPLTCHGCHNLLLLYFILCLTTSICQTNQTHTRSPSEQILKSEKSFRVCDLCHKFW